MGTHLTLTSGDGHTLDAYRADPEGEPKGGVVVIQEVFGVNAHIRAVVDGFAADGYTAIAPALFDRVRRGVDLGYDEEGITTGRALVAELGWENPTTDVWAAAKALHPAGSVGVVGYCWGGTVDWLAACRLDVACVSAYYGRQIIDFKDEKPNCPAIMHFGAEDPLIPMETVEAVRAAYPDVPTYIYEGAGHGFNCDARADYRPESAALARERTLALLADNLVG